MRSQEQGRDFPATTIDHHRSRICALKVFSASVAAQTPRKKTNHGAANISACSARAGTCHQSRATNAAPTAEPTVPGATGNSPRGATSEIQTASVGDFLVKRFLASGTFAGILICLLSAAKGSRDSERPESQCRDQLAPFATERPEGIAFRHDFFAR